MLRVVFVVVFLFVFACAHVSRSTDPALWVEVTTEHFVLRTDLPPDDARKAAADLELIRSALLAAAWHSSKEAGGRTQVVELADDRELREFAKKGLEGFVASDAFDEPIMVVTASQEEQQIFKHELSHVVTRGYLVSKPRWVDEGIATYLETLKLDRGSGNFEVGRLSRDRLAFLRAYPVLDYTSVLHTGREAELMDAQAGYAFESAAWLIVHYLVDTRPQRFDAFLGRLARGERADQAFQAEFIDLDEATLRSAIATYWKSGLAQIGTGHVQPWTGPIELQPMDPAEVYALRADLFRLAPGYRIGERTGPMQAEIDRALAIDPGNPRALELSRDADPAPAIAAHPDDWRTWVLVADRKKDPAAIEKAARLAPENAGVLARLAITDANRGAASQALAHALRAAELAPGRSDILDVLAQALSVNKRCDDARDVEQRAIDALSDAAPPSAVRMLGQRMEWIAVNCGARDVQRQIVTRVVRKGCTRPLPRATSRDHVEGGIRAEFTIREDGTVADVVLKGSATARLMEAVKKHIESCTFEPTLDGGKPIAVQSTIEVTFQRAGSK